MKKVHLKSAIPIYIAAAVWLLAGLVFPKLLMKLPGFLVTAVVSCAGYFAGSKVFPGRDITVEEKIETGDAKLDRDIAEGRARLEKLREANAAIPHPGITANLNRMTKAGEQIFQALGREPRKAAMVRRFMSYYLPTAEKLMEQYRLLDEAQVKGENIENAMKRIESSSGMIADAFEKCADNLYKDSDMDIDAEIQVMKTMLTGDSLLDSTVNDIRSVAKKAPQTSQAPQASQASQASQTSQASQASQASPAGEDEDPSKRKITLTLGGK